MKNISLVFILSLILQVAIAQGNWQTEKPSKTGLNPVPFANSITSDDLAKHLNVLASDEYEGRETGTEGQRKAAHYIADHFRSLGLPDIMGEDAYFQKISFISERWKNIRMSVNGDPVKHLWDFYSFPSTNAHRDTVKVDEIVFLGYGIDDENYSDYEGVDVNGKTILIYDKEPIGKKGISHVTNTTELSDWSTDWRKKLNAAKKHGVSTVLIIDSDFKANMAEARKVIVNRSLEIGAGELPEENYANNCFISSTIAKKIIGDSFKDLVKARKKIQKKGKARNLTLACQFELIQRKKVRSIQGENVLGFVEGTDADLKDEVIIVTAHYDHLGKKGNSIYNGADDNGSGTSTVLEVAEAFAKAKKQGNGPRRSILFMLVSGEEKGLLGSEYYASNPVFPLAQTVANVNVDMVGRVDKKHEDNPNYIYVIGADRLSTALHEINETANTTYVNLELDYTYNEKNDPNRYYYRSDHYNFAEKGIPAIFYFNGTHEDYHKISDTVDKINFEKMAKIGQLVFHTTWELANRDERIQVDVFDEE